MRAPLVLKFYDYVGIPVKKWEFLEVPISYFDKVLKSEDGNV